jgi:hypothetical protein
MEKIQRDALTGHIEALGVELRIAKVTIPGVRDGLNVARVTAFTDSVRRICAITEKLAKTAGLNNTSHIEESVNGTTNHQEEQE